MAPVAWASQPNRLAAVGRLRGVSDRKRPNYSAGGSDGEAGGACVAVRGPLRGASANSSPLVPGAG